MQLTRRRFFSLTVAGVAAGWRANAYQSVRDEALTRRIRSVIEEYGNQGFHRTGTPVDQRSGDWLFDAVARIGLSPNREPFTLDRVNPLTGRLVAGGRRIEGLPLFDGGFTDAAGVTGRLGVIGGNSEIGLVAAPPNTAAAGALGEARRANRHRAIVFVTRAPRPGLCPSNADSFLKPFGPPVLQVSSDEGSALDQLAAANAEVTVTAHVERVAATSFNVTAAIPGSAPALEPLVIMTPRSGWYASASERGGGIACWLEMQRVLQQPPPRRTVYFVASGGHELHHLGIDVFIRNRPGLVTNAIGWMHFGANIGAATPTNPQLAATADSRHAIAATGTANTIQASDDQREAILSRALTAVALPIGRRVPRGTVPGGEAENVHRGGGRYISVIGSNGLFHHPDDIGIHTVDVDAIARFTVAFTDVARALMAG